MNPETNISDGSDAAWIILRHGNECFFSFFIIININSGLYLYEYTRQCDQYCGDFNLSYKFAPIVKL